MITLHYSITEYQNTFIAYFWKEDKAGEKFQDAECHSLYHTDPSHDALEAYAEFVQNKFYCHKINVTNDTINVQNTLL